MDVHSAEVQTTRVELERLQSALLRSTAESTTLRRENGRLSVEKKALERQVARMTSDAADARSDMQQAVDEARRERNLLLAQMREYEAKITAHQEEEARQLQRQQQQQAPPQQRGGGRGGSEGGGSLRDEDADAHTHRSSGQGSRSTGARRRSQQHRNPGNGSVGGVQRTRWRGASHRRNDIFEWSSEDELEGTRGLGSGMLRMAAMQHQQPWQAPHQPSQSSLPQGRGVCKEGASNSSGASASASNRSLSRGGGGSELGGDSASLSPEPRTLTEQLDKLVLAGRGLLESDTESNDDEGGGGGP